MLVKIILFTFKHSKSQMPYILSTDFRLRVKNFCPKRSLRQRDQVASLPAPKLVGTLRCWILSIKFKISLRKWDKCRGAARMGDLLPAYCFSWHLPCDFQVTCLPYCYFLTFQYLTLSLLTSSCGRRACGSFPATNLLFHSVHWQSRAFQYGHLVLHT